MTNLNLYYVVMCKNDEILYSEAGPFHEQRAAEIEMGRLNEEDQSHSTYYHRVARSTVAVELV